MTLFVSSADEQSWRASIRIGDFIDCMDCDNKWYESVVVNTDTNGNISVHYRGWSSFFDVVLQRNSYRIQQRFTRTNPWREFLNVGDFVEVKSLAPTDTWMWYIGIIKHINDNTGIVNVLFGSHNQYHSSIHIESDHICILGTHVRTDQRILISKETIRMMKTCQQERQKCNTKKRLVNRDTITGDSCCVCLTNQRDVLLLPCKHLCMCSYCSNLNLFMKCPLCLQEIHEKMCVFI